MTPLLCALALLATDAWVVVHDDRSSTMHGDMDDIRLARRHLREIGPGYLWFRHEGKEYVVRDGAAIKTIEEAVQPQEELGKTQGDLGRRQADLGQQQAK